MDKLDHNNNQTPSNPPALGEELSAGKHNRF